MPRRGALPCVGVVRACRHQLSDIFNTFRVSLDIQKLLKLFCTNTTTLREPRGTPGSCQLVEGGDGPYSNRSRHSWGPVTVLVRYDLKY